MYSLIDLQLKFKNDSMLAELMSEVRGNEVYLGNSRVEIAAKLTVERLEQEMMALKDAVKHHTYYNGFELCSILKHMDALEHVKELLIQSSIRRRCVCL